MERSVIFQMGYSYVIFRFCHAGYIIFFVWNFTLEYLRTPGIWFGRYGSIFFGTVWGDMVYGTCDILVGPYYKGSKFYSDRLLNSLVLLPGMELLLILLIVEIIFTFNL